MWSQYYAYIHHIIIILRFCSVSLPRIDNMPHDYLLCLSFSARVAPLRKIEVLNKLLWVASWKRTAEFFFVFLWQMVHNRGFFKRCLFFWQKCKLREITNNCNYTEWIIAFTEKKKCFRGFVLSLFVVQNNETEIIKGEINLLRIIIADRPQFD